ncbi:MAG: hypothetical protein AAFX50_14530, partial [Acidobacteriota bacterium]
MPNPVVDHLCRGTYIFVRPEPADITRVIPDAENILPMPQKIFQKDEKTDPLTGLPILRSRPLDQLGKLFADYLQAEEEAQAAAVTNSAFDSQALQMRWELYRTALTQTLENTLVSSIGVDYTSIFWLHHSLEASRL